MHKFKVLLIPWLAIFIKVWIDYVNFSGVGGGEILKEFWLYVWKKKRIEKFLSTFFVIDIDFNCSNRNS